MITKGKQTRIFDHICELQILQTQIGEPLKTEKKKRIAGLN